MAIDYISNKPLTHSATDGRGASAHLAYRDCSELECIRNGEIYNFEGKGSRIKSGLFGSTGNLNLQGFAESLELAERKKNGEEKAGTTRWGREIIVANAHELSPKKQWEHLTAIADHLIDKYGIAVHIAHHRPDPLRAKEDRSIDSLKNFHGHLTISERKMINGKFEGKKIRELIHKDFTKEIKEFSRNWINNALQSEGHQPMPARNPQHIAQVHMGHEISAQERKGNPTRIGDINRLVKAHNAEVDEAPFGSLKADTLANKISKAKAELKAPEQDKPKGFYVIETHRAIHRNINEAQQGIERRERAFSEENAQDWRTRSGEQEAEETASRSGAIEREAQQASQRFR